MSDCDNFSNYYWPYAANEEIQHFQFVMCLDRILTLSDGSTFHFGNMETYSHPFDNVVVMIYYICATTPHEHPVLPSCTRLVMCFRVNAQN